MERILNPADPLFRPGTESRSCAPHLSSRPGSFSDLPVPSWNRPASTVSLTVPRGPAILHKSTNTRLRVIGSNGKTAFGLVNTPWAICDEPGAWETTGGQLLFDAIETAKGKPQLAAAKSLHWDDCASHGRVVERAGDLASPARAASSSAYREIVPSGIAGPRSAAVNPLTKISPEFRKQLRAELKAAIADSRLKARFLSFRLNLPSADEATMLLTTDDFEIMANREVTERRGRPIVAVDLGGGRAWSAAVAVWQSGRIEAIAIAPGIPGIEEQENRDQVAPGTYARLLETGRLRMAHGLRVQPPAALMAAITDAWGEPELIVCDRFRLGELKDCTNGTQVIPRVSRWSEAGDDIRALRRLVKDGPFTVAETSRPLLAASLAVAMVRNDDQGNTRLTKKASNNTSRDDVAAALVLGAGVFQRARAQPKRTGAYLGTV